MQLQPSRDTAPELALRRELHRRGLRYRVHMPILDGRRKHDIVFSGAGVVVEVLGCFWHRCPQHSTSPPSMRGEPTVINADARLAAPPRARCAVEVLTD
ncbi:MAG: hypothetical protein RL219_2589 [Actinomycetota bacterium]|jgi:DNA mismatch endonuclease (patch repair protein)